MNKDTALKFIVIGHKGHGKDTVCSIIESLYQLRFKSSSEMANELFLFEQLRETFGYDSLEACYSDRVNHRKLWYERICDYNANDRTRLGTEIFKEHEVYCGLRDREEFEALVAKFQPIVIYVDASERLPLESEESMKLGIEDANWVISNNGPETVLPTAVKSVMDQILAQYGHLAPSSLM